MINKKIKIVKAQNEKIKPKNYHMDFGSVFTDHMFVMDYEEGTGWHNPQIIPYGPITLDPAAMVFHYGQTVFDGFKTYRSNDDRILMFRPEENLKRMNFSNSRLCIPSIDENFILKALKKLVHVDRDWVPAFTDRAALYVRPLIISTESTFLVRPSKTYKFMIILSPVGNYYDEGINPVSINVEEEYTRAVTGGTGAAKTAANYSSSYKAQEKAKAKGSAQVLWLDAFEKKYIEEVGSMNIFVKINGEVITPPLSGTILGGITRLSVIDLLKQWKIPVIERNISIDELYQASADGNLEEVFGTGTAVVISPVGELNWQEKKMVINNGNTGELSKKIYEKLTGIQTGALQDPNNWNVEVK